MNDGFHIDVRGFEELKEKIKKLSDPRDKKREILGILRQVAGATVTKAKELAPVSKKPHVARKVIIQPRNLQKSIGTITGKKGNAAINPTVYAGPRARGANKGWYGAMVEAGHNIYRNATSVRSRGKIVSRSSLARVRGRGKNNAVGYVSGSWYMKRAYESTQGKVTPEAEAKIARYIQRRIDRL
jgi:hypothetical protein